ncbi:hypothetical protein cce_4059 [Crocosphaera subtropica ATCC 51142]|uniref:Uncharacterized protein n=1 Tax=Crocosphaera subtropica (strain ATCC 51142 / BH68) TaxID=43989 RepID=B1WQV5_CROS5|nr:hypothetical protein cce_4059 [Crocosphaera subtropica ATCC 51142]
MKHGDLITINLKIKAIAFYQRSDRLYPISKIKGLKISFL